MDKIKLQRANVIKEVDSEDRAKTLEAQGFVRMDGKSARVPAGMGDADKLQKELAQTKEKLQAAESKAEAVEKELESMKTQLRDAEKKTQDLETELEGTKEQLEAAVKQNKAASKK